MLLRQSLSLLLVATASTAMAFDINGFVSQASGDDALRILKSRFSNVRQVQATSQTKQTYIGSGPDGMSESITICHGRLWSYQYDIAGGAKAFIRMVERERLANGPGTSDVSAQETRVGDWSQIKFAWRVGGEMKEIGYSLINDEQQTYVSYAIGAGVCK